MNNSQYFQITGLNKLQNIVDTMDMISDEDQQEEEMVSPRFQFQVRRKSTASLMTRPPSGRLSRPGSGASLMSVTSELVQVTIRANTTRPASAHHNHDDDDDVKNEMIHVPIIIVTVPHENDEDDNTEAWDNNYKNFKFMLKKSLKEKETYLEKRILRDRRRSSTDSVNAAEKVQKMRMKQRRKKMSNLKKSKIKPY